MDLFNQGEWTTAIFGLIPMEWIVLGGLVIVAVMSGRFEAKNILRENKLDPKALTIDQFFRGLPFFVLSFSERILKTLNLWLKIIFLLFVILSWTLPWTLDLLIRQTYALAGQEALYDGGAFRTKIEGFQEQLLAPVGFQIIAMLSHVYASFRTRGGMKFRPLAAIIELVAFVAATFWTFAIIWPFAEANAVTLVQVSISASDIRAMVAQFLLAPVYTQFLLIGLGFVYVVLASVLMLVRLGWSRFKAGDPKLMRPDGVRARIIKSQNDVFQSMMTIGAGATASFALTVAVLLFGSQVGEMAGGGRLVPAPRILVVNAVADGMTLFMTCFLLARWANRSRPRIKAALSDTEDSEAGSAGIVPLLVIIVIDLILASALAVGGVVFSLQGTQWEVTFKQALNILFGLSPDGGSLNFNEVFWLMHSTFLPTLVYLSMLMVSCIFALMWLSRLSGLFTSLTSWMDKRDMRLAMGLAHIAILFAAPTYILKQISQYLPQFVSKDEYIMTVSGLLSVVPSSFGG